MQSVFFRDMAIGRIGIQEDDGRVTRLYLPVETPGPTAPPCCPTPFLEDAFAQLEEYLAGRRRDFTLPLAPTGTDFQLRVWAELQKIPYGQRVSYAEIARRVGNPQACRAVGMANHRNVISIFIPCHRVVGASGKLVGYSAGLDIKRQLLELETGNC